MPVGASSTARMVDIATWRGSFGRIVVWKRGGIITLQTQKQNWYLGTQNVDVVVCSKRDGCRLCDEMDARAGLPRQK